MYRPPPAADFRSRHAGMKRALRRSRAPFEANACVWRSEWVKLENKPATQLERARIRCRTGVGIELRTPERVYVTGKIRVI